MSRAIIFTVLLTILPVILTAEFPVPQIDFFPEHYFCNFIETPLDIDGKLDESAWELAYWSDPFVDIEGKIIPTPNYLTRIKMLWDAQYFYVAAELEEPHIWATLTERDAVIFHDNDFEVFIDPDGDTHDYFELEINALGTIWDLFLVKPYRDRQQVALDAWDINGLKSAVHLNGTLNDPSDYDKNWTVELAFPWKVLSQCANTAAPPDPGDHWRLNFSRVQWYHKIEENRYVKLGKPEENWVWSPQGIINMHYPEMWGYVVFSSDPPGYGEPEFTLPPEETGKWIMRQVYYAQRNYFEQNGDYALDTGLLDLEDPGVGNINWPPVINKTATMWEAVLELKDPDRKIHIRNDGRVWMGDTN